MLLTAPQCMQEQCIASVLQSLNIINKDMKSRTPEWPCRCCASSGACRSVSLLVPRGAQRRGGRLHHRRSPAVLAPGRPKAGQREGTAQQPPFPADIAVVTAAGSRTPPRAVSGQSPMNQNLSILSEDVWRGDSLFILQNNTTETASSAISSCFAILRKYNFLKYFVPRGDFSDLLHSDAQTSPIEQSQF